MRPFSSFILPILMIMVTIQSTQPHNFINSTCRKLAQDDPNINFDFCATSLQAAPASRCATLRGLRRISFHLVRDNVTDTRCYIRHLLAKGKWDPYVKQCLRDCVELFSDAISDVKEATKSYNGNRSDDANVRISAVMDAPTTCEDGFMDRQGAVSPLTKRNNDAFQLSAIALSLMSLIEMESK